MSKIILMFLLGVFVLGNQLQATPYPTDPSHKKVSFVGGNEALQTFIQNNLVYPEICRENAIEGVVKVKIYISPEGNVFQVNILESPDEACEEEVKRIIQKMPKWEPATYKGRAIPSRIVLSFKFELLT